MADFVTQDEFKQLATRVDVIEREVEGEKLVTRHVLEQTRHNGDDLAARQCASQIHPSEHDRPSDDGSYSRRNLAAFE
jgi:hypothetical protein